MRLDLADNAPQYLVQVARQGVVGQVDITNRPVDGGVVEKIELLLVAQHLQRRLTEHGKEQRRALRRGQGEHHLVREGGFAAAWRAGDQVERKLRQATAQDLVQSWHTRGQTVDSHFGAHGEISCEEVSLEEGCHTPTSRRAVSEGPISVVRSS